MADDDAAVKAKLAALDAEVRADADAQRVRREAAMTKVKEQRAAQQAERDELRTRQAAIVSKKKAPDIIDIGERPADDDDGDRDRDPTGVGGALELANKANRVKAELTRKPKKGEKSWVKSGIASMALGPIGWLYAGSLREAVPASLAWVLGAILVSKILPSVLIMPVLMVALPLSGIAGAVYALSYNKHGSRQRLFNKENASPPKQLK